MGATRLANWSGDIAGAGGPACSGDGGNPCATKGVPNWSTSRAQTMLSAFRKTSWTLVFIIFFTSVSDLTVWTRATTTRLSSSVRESFRPGSEPESLWFHWCMSTLASRIDARAGPNFNFLINGALLQRIRLAGGCKPPPLLTRSHRLAIGLPAQACRPGPHRHPPRHFQHVRALARSSAMRPKRGFLEDAGQIRGRFLDRTVEPEIPPRAEGRIAAFYQFSFFFCRDQR